MKTNQSMLRSILPHFIILVTIAVLCSCSSENKICITIDDLPTVSYGIGGYGMRLEITEKIVQKCQEYHIPAIGFVNERKLYRDGKPSAAEIKLLEKWLENGLELGNHTFGHLDYHKVGYDVYTDDIFRGENITKPLTYKFGMDFKFFRHPYLRSGENQSKSDSLQKFLLDHHYTESPVTIDNDDYLFAKAYSMAYESQNQPRMDSIGRSYVDYMERKLVFYETLSSDLFERNINHTLLIHASLLNADYLDELAEMFIRNGYSFVSQSHVLEDPVYQTEITKFGNWGISWIDRWAMSQGKPRVYSRDDPEVPDFVRLSL